MTDEILESLMERVSTLEDCMDILRHRIDMFFESQININELTLNQLTELRKQIKG